MTGGQEVASSSLVTPTCLTSSYRLSFVAVFFYVLTNIPTNLQHDV